MGLINMHRLSVIRFIRSISPDNKDRLSMIDTLLHSRERFFRINQDALSYLERVGLAKGKVELVAQLPHDQDFNEAES